MPDSIFENGEGIRGCINLEEFNAYDPMMVYISCLRCNNQWEVFKYIWKDNLPIICSVCSGRWLEHKYIEYDVITKKWLRINGELQEVNIDDPVRRSVIKRLVQIDKTT